MLAFDNADVQSIVISERPDVAGNPYKGGICSNGSRVGIPSCWFNPNAFAVPAPGQFGNAGRNILRGPGFVQCDLALQKGFQLTEDTKIVLGVEGYICSIIRILQSRVTRRARLRREGTEMLSLRTQRVISPTTSAEYSAR